MLFSLVLSFLVGSVLLVALSRRAVGARARLFFLLCDALVVAWAFLFALLLVHVVAALASARQGELGKSGLASASAVALLVALCPGRSRRGVASALALALVGLALVDVAWARAFGGVAPLGVSSVGSLVPDLLGVALAALEPWDAWLLALALSALALPFLARGRLAQSRPGWLAVVLSYAAPVVLLAPGAGWIQLDLATLPDEGEGAPRTGPKEHLARAGFLLAHLRELALDFQTPLPLAPISDEERREVEAFFRERARILAPPGLAAGIAEGKSLLLLRVPALDKWIVGAKLAGREVTPFLNRLRERALYAPSTFDQLAGLSPEAGDYLVLASQHPPATDLATLARRGSRFVTLAGLFGARGYDTLVMHAEPEAVRARAVLHPRFGFSRTLFVGPARGRPPASLDAFLDEAAATLERVSPPFFAFLLAPSRPPQEGCEDLPLGPLEGTKVGAYLRRAAAVDRAIERFFDRLDAVGVLDEAVVILYGEREERLEVPQGERLRLKEVLEADALERGQIGKATWWTSRVPLFVRLPRGEPSGVIEGVGGPIDVAPTALHLLGLPRPASFVGRVRLLENEQTMVVRQDGSAASDERVWDAARGHCFERRRLTRRPRAECAELRERAAREVLMSTRVALYDLAVPLASIAAKAAKAHRTDAP